MALSAAVGVDQGTSSHGDNMGVDHVRRDTDPALAKMTAVAVEDTLSRCCNETAKTFNIDILGLKLHVGQISLPPTKKKKNVCPHPIAKLQSQIKTFVCICVSLSLFLFVCLFVCLFCLFCHFFRNQSEDIFW